LDDISVHPKQYIAYCL